MRFENELHYKNYIRKIAESCGYDKYDFEETKMPETLINVYRFQSENEIEILAIGLPNIIDHYIKEFKQLNYLGESEKINSFFEIFHEIYEVYEEAKIVCEQLKRDSIKKDFNLFNYFDSEFLYPYKRLKQLVKTNNKFNTLNEHEFIPSTEFKNFIEKHIGKFGLYFLYDNSKSLMYIGKSTNLGDRILSSISQRQIKGFIKIALTKTIADIHVYEPYYILKENPFLNVEFKAYDNLSIELKPLKKSKLIKILYKN